MKNWIIGLVALVVLAGGWLYFVQQENPNDEVAKIGFITPLTGPFPDWGESIQNGVLLAVEDTKHNIAVVYEDDACDAKQAVGIAQKFFSLENIHVIIGPGCDDSLKAIAPIAKENNALLLSTGLLGDEVFIENPTHVVNLATQISTEAEHMAAHLNAQGIKTLSIVHGSNSFGQELAKQLPKKLAPYGIEVVSNENTSLELSDFRTVIAKALQKNPDAFYIHHSLQGVGIFTKQLKEAEQDATVYSLYSTESPSTLAAGGDAVNGIQYTYSINSADGSVRKKRFETRYQERFGTDPTPNSYFVYDGVLLIDQALDECSAEDGACIEQFLKSYGTYEGISGQMEIQSDGKNVRPFGIKEIQNGEYIWITKDIEL